MGKMVVQKGKGLVHPPHKGKKKKAAAKVGKKKKSPFAAKNPGKKVVAKKSSGAEYWDSMTKKMKSGTSKHNK